MAAIIYFQRDLRGSDNPALAAATVAALAAPGPLLAYAHFPANHPSPLVRQAHANALAELDQSCAGRLHIGAQNPVETLVDLAQYLSHSAAQPVQVYCSHQYTPAGIEHLRQLAAALNKVGAELIACGDAYAISPGTLRTGEGGNYRVFTPFSKRWFATGWLPPLPTHLADGRAHLAAGVAEIIDVLPPQLASRARAQRLGQSRYLGGVDFRGENDCAIEVELAFRADFPKVDLRPELPPADAPWTTRVGQDSARERWQQFLDEALVGYRTRRDILAASGTSKLSVQLAFGTVHPRTLLDDLTRLRDRGSAEIAEATTKFASELAWREFYADFLFTNPHTGWEDVNPAFAAMQWDQDQRLFAAWRKGETGFPVIDAAMRQLANTGWMHNRARMLVASFLTKDLHLPWQWGARYFLDTLVDADFASNQHSWQWCAGTGTDAAPFFRIFNPTLQGKKFDPEGAYLCRWLGEFIDPQSKPDSPLERAKWAKNLHEGKGYLPTYPEPIVDHAVERLRALERYQNR